MKCTACGSALEIGFIPDRSHVETLAAVWVRGEPAANRGLWNRLRTGGGVSISDVEAKAIDAYRCSACGHIELYATREPEDGTTAAR